MNELLKEVIAQLSGSDAERLEREIIKFLDNIYGAEDVTIDDEGLGFILDTQDFDFSEKQLKELDHIADANNYVMEDTKDGIINFWIYPVDSDMEATAQTQKRPPKGEIDKLIKAYALMKYSKKQNAQMQMQQKFDDSFYKLWDKMSDKYPHVDMTSDHFWSMMGSKADEWWNSKAMRGPGVDW